MPHPLNRFIVSAWDQDGDPILTDHIIEARWYGSAWTRALAVALEAIPDSTGQNLGRLEVHRLSSRAEGET